MKFSFFILPRWGTICQLVFVYNEISLDKRNIPAQYGSKTTEFAQKYSVPNQPFLSMYGKDYN
jgi:hypothetical protein